MEESKVFSKKEMRKKEAAKEAYYYVKDVLCEDNVGNYMDAAVLKDLFDCKVCVMSVSQVYLKGIIFPKSEIEFGVDEMIDEDELRRIEERVLDVSKRKPPMKK